MLPVHDANRAYITWCSLLVAAAAGTLLPLVAMPAAPGIAAMAAAPQEKPLHDASPWKAQPVLVARDPFVPNPKYAPKAPEARTPVSAPATATIAVKAIAIGRVPQALVEVDGKARIVAPGDRLGTVRVRAISPGRIELSDGSVLLFSP
jgi:hypothetical protein